MNDAVTSCKGYKAHLIKVIFICYSYSITDTVSGFLNEPQWADCSIPGDIGVKIGQEGGRVDSPVFKLRLSERRPGLNPCQSQPVLSQIFHRTSRNISSLTMSDSSCSVSFIILENSLGNLYKFKLARLLLGYTPNFKNVTLVLFVHC